MDSMAQNQQAADCGFIVNRLAFIKAIRDCLPWADNTSGHYDLQNICLEVNPGGVWVVATNGHALVGTPLRASTFGAITPRTYLVSTAGTRKKKSEAQHLLKFIEGLKDYQSLRIAFLESEVDVEGCRFLLDKKSNYPDWHRILPKKGEHNCAVTVEAEAFREHLQRELSDFRQQRRAWRKGDDPVNPSYLFTKGTGGRMHATNVLTEGDVNCAFDVQHLATLFERMRGTVTIHTTESADYSTPCRIDCKDRVLRIIMKRRT